MTTHLQADATAAMAHGPEPAAEAPPGHARRWYALIAITIPLIMVGIDGTILNVALPTIARSLDASSAQLVWINSAYIIVFGSTILLAASLGDRFGRRRILVIGMAVFIVGSVGSGIAGRVDSIHLLVVSRGVQGLGAAAIPPCTLSIIRGLFTDERERARAIGFWAGLTGVGLAVGPILGGLILGATTDWGWIFYINVPVVAIGFLLLGLWVRDVRAGKATSLDLPGATLSLLGLLALFCGLIEGPVKGWGSIDVLAALGVGLVLLATFVAFERRRTDPELDPRLFTRGPFLSGVAVIAIAFFALMGMVYQLTLYLQDVRGYSPLKAGAALVPFALMLFLLAPVAPRLVESHGARSVVVTGLLLLAGGLLVFLATSTASSYGIVLFGLVLAGAGVALVQPPASAAMMGAVSADEAGMASGTNSAIRQLGASVGITVLGGVIGQTAFKNNLTASHVFQSLPADAQSAAAAGITPAVQVAQRIAAAGEGGAAADSAAAAQSAGAALLRAAETGFVTGLHDSVLVAAAVTAAGLLLAVLLIPGNARPASEDTEDVKGKAA